MLTRDLLRFKMSGAYAKIQFVSAEDPALLRLASSLITLFENSLHTTRQELQEQLSALVNASRDIPLAKGLVKLLMDKSRFSGTVSDSETSFEEQRHALFLRSMELLKAEVCPADMENFRDQVWNAFPERTERTLYCDLPEYEELIHVEKIYPKELLERYNVSLVQSMILYAGELDCTLYGGDVALLRRFFKYLKFFRLLFTAETKKKSGEGSIRLKIDGPASLLEHNTRYGLLLACFFPALCAFPKWKASCELKIRDRKIRLKLDESAPLHWSYTNFGAYVPEEFKMFQDYFIQKQHESPWKMIPRESFLRLEGNKLSFPDFRFRYENEGGSPLEVDVELFHPWHKHELLQRMTFLESHSDIPLILGVDRSCLKKDEILTERLKAGAGNFLFSGYPGVENVLKALEKYRTKSSSSTPRKKK